MNVECVESCLCSVSSASSSSCRVICQTKRCSKMRRNQSQSQTRRRYRLRCGCWLCCCWQAKQVENEFDTLSWRQVVRGDCPAVAQVGGVKVPAKKYKLRVMRRAAIDGSHFLCETPAAAAAADGPGRLLGPNVRINELPMNRMRLPPPVCPTLSSTSITCHVSFSI